MRRNITTPPGEPAASWSPMGGAAERRPVPYLRTTKTSTLVRRPDWSLVTRIVWEPLALHVLLVMIWPSWVEDARRLKRPMSLPSAYTLA